MLADVWPDVYYVPTMSNNYNPERERVVKLTVTVILLLIRICGILQLEDGSF